jgi:hypothetical protein
MTTITNRNRSIIVEFFPKSFDSGKVLTYRGILLSNIRYGLLQLKNSQAILLCITILKILPHVLRGCDIYDSIVNFLGYRIENLGNN